MGSGAIKQRLDEALSSCRLLIPFGKNRVRRHFVTGNFGHVGLASISS
jgi:hypothetical protein